MVKARAPKRKEPESQAAQAGYRAQDMTPEYSGRFSFSGEGEQRPCRRGASLHTSLSLSLSLSLSRSLPLSPSLSRSLFLLLSFFSSLSLSLSLSCSPLLRRGRERQAPTSSFKGSPDLCRISETPEVPRTVKKRKREPRDEDKATILCAVLRLR